MNTPDRSENPTPAITPETKRRDGLNLTPAEAAREAGKLRGLRENLEERKRIDDTSARSNPTGRHDE